MRLYFYLLFSFIFIGAFSVTWAQDTHFKCGHDAYMQKVWSENPQMKEEYRQLFESAKQTRVDGFTSKTTYLIPIVFHIIHENGAENISDAQVYDQMDILNEDFQMLNTDVANAVAGFDTIAGSAGITFKLAAIDPWGNCTNGIEHIYSHETNIGDDYSKLNQWPRSKYLNVWVVNKMRDGVAGYAYFPSSTDGQLFFADGIIILKDYIGSFGTSNPGRSRALTHEIGHYLALPHVWGNNNDPNVACGDDGIDDTPKTKGFTFCPSPAQAKVCTDSIVENYQNFMDYSYCSIMFTEGQNHIMRNTLITESGNRNMLVLDSIHTLTGVNLATVPLCAPVAEFSTPKLAICKNNTVQFKDQSWNAVVDSREWIFEDATPSTSSAAAPTVEFNSPGWKKVTLIVSNAVGTDTFTMDKAVYVYGDWSDVSGPKTENFETVSAYNFVSINPEASSPGFELAAGVGMNNSTCYALKNYKDISSSISFSNDYFYKLRMGGSKDYLYSPTYDLRYTSSATLSFDFAYASEAFSQEQITESLVISSSTNCGNTWTPRKTMTGVELLTGGNSSNISFVPTAQQWKNVSINLPAALKTENVMFRFEFVASDLSNNLYIDNINLGGVLIAQDEVFAAMNVNVYPNPTSATEGIVVEYTANENQVNIELLDLAGKVLSSEVVKTTNSNVSHKLNTANGLTSGIYLVKVSQGSHQLVKKVVVL